MLREYTIIIRGTEDSDVEMVLEEVLRLIKEGYHSGLNSNDTGSFEFDSKEEEL